MTLRVSCPSCRHILTVPVEAAGQAGTCPNCGQRLRVPGGRTALAAPYLPGQKTALEDGTPAPTAASSAIQHPVAVLVPTAAVAAENKRWPLRTLVLAGAVLAVGLLATGVGIGYKLAEWQTRGGDEPPRAANDQPLSARPVGNRPSSSRSAASDLWERKDLEARLSQATPEQVRQLLGKPDTVAPLKGGGSPQAGITTNQGYRDELQIAVLGQTVGEVWTYHNKTRSPDTGKPDPNLRICIEQGRVALIICAPIIIKNDTNGLENMGP